MHVVKLCGGLQDGNIIMTLEYSLWGLKETKSCLMRVIYRGVVKRLDSIEVKLAHKVIYTHNGYIYWGYKSYPSNGLTRTCWIYEPIVLFVQHFFQDLQEDIKKLHPEGLIGFLNERKYFKSMDCVLGLLDKLLIQKWALAICTKVHNE